jgi:2-keto-3-deoxy-6-phosphogluconate aldolase
MTEAVVLKAVERDGIVLQYVPDSLMTEAIVLKAVERGYDALQYVPGSLITEPVVLKAVEHGYNALQYVTSLDLFLRVAKKFNIPVDAPALEEAKNAE